MITIAQETLDLRRTGFSPVLSLLIPAYSLLSAPAVLSVNLHRPENAPLPLSRRRTGVTTLSFGVALEPRWIFGAEPFDQ